MPIYEIYRRYRFEAANPTQALKQLFDAVEARKEEDFHVSDSVRESDRGALPNSYGAGISRLPMARCL